MTNIHDRLIMQAKDLARLLRTTARDAEQARQPLNIVMDALRETELLAMMAPKRYGGLEMDIDTFFEVVLELSQADAAMGWLIGFYIEHNYWYCHYPQHVQDMVYGEKNYALAPATLNIAGGKATKCDGGYRLTGRWQWGTGIVHASWVMVGAMVEEAEGQLLPMFFLLPRAEVNTIDNWHIAGMSATGSQDILVEDVFVAADYVQPFIAMLNGTSGIKERYNAPVYKTPMVQLLSFAAAIPILGAAKMALHELCEQTKPKFKAGDTSGRNPTGKFIPTAKAALTIEAAELLMRNTVAELMSERDSATIQKRGEWSAKITHAVYMCREAVQLISENAGASGHFLSNPIQKALRDINTATCHVVFDKNSRYGDYGAILFEQPHTSMLL
jgi:alkylation response protein AidB-like acyl-CoA dehydrogenase